MTTGDARHYASGMDIDLYEAAEVTVERDGPNLIRIEALSGDPEDPGARTWGRPGVSIELSLDAAIDLMARLSEVTMP